MEKNLDIMKPCYSKHNLPVPLPFFISRFHCSCCVQRYLCWVEQNKRNQSSKSTKKVSILAQNSETLRYKLQCCPQQKTGGGVKSFSHRERCSWKMKMSQSPMHNHWPFVVEIKVTKHVFLKNPRGLYNTSWLMLFPVFRFLQNINFRIIFEHWSLHYHANETKSQEYEQDALSLATTHQQMNKAARGLTIIPTKS